MSNRLQNIRVARISAIPYSVLIQLRTQLEAINQAGFKITVITSNKGICDDLDPLNFCEFKSINIAREISFLSDVVSLFKLWSLFCKRKFDVVHSTTPKAGVLCAIASRLAGISVRLHTFTGQPWVTMHGFKRTVVKFCDRLIVLLNTQCYVDSFSQREFLIKSKVGTQEKLIVLGSGSLAGVDLRRFNDANFSEERKKEIRLNLELREEALVLLFVGRVTSEKGIYELVEATRQLLANGHDIALLIVGPFEKQYEQKIKRHALERCGQHVLFTDFSAIPEQFMAIADILCIPSYREGFGTVVIEAAAMGLPTVGTKIYGLTDAVIDGHTGILVEPKNVSQLSTALEDLITNAPLRKQLGKNAKKRAIDEFDSRKHGSLLIKEYERLLK